jgi:hypothetical protein
MIPLLSYFCRKLLQQPVDKYPQALGDVAVLRINHVERIDPRSPFFQDFHQRAFAQRVVGRITECLDDAESRQPGG